MNDAMRDAFDTGFILKTNTEYAAWCSTYYQADALDERGMKSLHGLWAWQAATLAAQRQPLSDEQLFTLMDSVGFAYNPAKFARAVEAAHGITATPQGKI